MTTMQRIDLSGYGLSSDQPDSIEIYKKVFRPTFRDLVSGASVTKAQWQGLFFDVHQIMMWHDNDPTNHPIARLTFEQLKSDVEEIVRRKFYVLEYEKDDGTFLKAYATSWREFFVITSYCHLPFHDIERALLELEDFHTSKFDEFKVIRRMMLRVWHENLLMPLTQRLLRIVGDQLNVYREEGIEIIYGDQIIAVRDSFYVVSHNGDVFRENYEKVYLSQMAQFYTLASQQHFANSSVLDYVRWALGSFATEQRRAEKYLIPGPRYRAPISRMNEKLIEILIKDRNIYDAVLAEAKNLIESRQSEPLALCYQLLDRLPVGIDSLVDSVQEHIIRRGKDDMLESAAVISNDPEKYVEKLLGLYESFSKLVKEAFNDDHRIMSARDKGFQEVVNDTTIFQLNMTGKTKHLGLESRCPDLLATYCDSLLRKTSHSRRMSSEEISEKLKQVAQVLKYINSRDIFVHLYQLNLARRLILGLSVDSELEEEMSKLLGAVGMPSDVMNRIHRMFTDIRISDDLCKEWQDYRASILSSNSPEVSPAVLNICSWARPNMERISCALPLEVEDISTEFVNWYLGKFSGKKIHLVESASHLTLQFTSSYGSYDLELTFYQLAILRSFQDRDAAKLTFEELRVTTGLPANELRRVLWGLCTVSKCGNFLLGYSPVAATMKDMSPSTKFWLNTIFAPMKGGKPQRRGRVNLIGKLHIASERLPEDEADGINELREFRVQEAIVKVMKTRKVAGITEIHTEIIEILKNLFLPSRKIVKEQIETLIEKECLNRDESDINVFHYRA